MKAEELTRGYAESFFGLAGVEGKAEAVESELYGVGRTIEGNVELKEFLVGDAPAEGKMAALEEIFGERLSPLTRNLVRIVVDEGRTELLPAVAKEFSAALEAARNEVIAEVTTAGPLTGDGARDIGEKLERITGKKIILKTFVDPEIVGGLKVRIGDRIIDASVKAQLADLHEEMVTGELKAEAQA